MPSARTVNRVLVRHGLVVERKRKRPRASFVPWKRPGPMQLWQIDIVGGVWSNDQNLWIPRPGDVKRRTFPRMI